MAKLRKDAFFIFGIFLVFFSLFALLQFSSPNIFGNDPYYHIKVAQLLRTRGWEIFEDGFKWLYFTIWHSHPTDLSFFYHILLVPFTFLGNLITASKLAASLFASLVFCAVFWVLYKNKIKYSFLWTLLLFFISATFVLRLCLSRAFVLSILFCILGFYLISKKRYAWLFILSLVYALTYTASQMIIVLALLFIAIEFLTSKKFDWKILASAILGNTIGLAIRPDFPQNLYVIFAQNFYVPLARLRLNLPLGAEMYSTNFFNFLKDNALVFLLFIFCLSLALIFIFIERKKSFQDQKTKLILYLASISGLFLCLVIFSQRFIEYWVPFVIIWAAFIFDSFFDFDKIKRFWKRKRTFFIVIVTCLAGLFLYFASHNVIGTIRLLKSSPPYDKYKKVSEWLIQNTKKGSIVFNVSWDNFPQLFFWNHHNYYIVGMDPAFMYYYNKDLYEKWRRIGERENLDEASRIIKEDFKSSYVFLDGRNKELDEDLEKREDFEKVYADEKAIIYKVK